eukprot:gene25884-biopygen1276
MSRGGVFATEIELESKLSIPRNTGSTASIPAHLWSPKEGAGKECSKIWFGGESPFPDDLLQGCWNKSGTSGIPA